MGEVVQQPWELREAEFVDGLCRRYHCLPSALLAEDASLLMRLNVMRLGERVEQRSSGLAATDFEVEF